MDKANHIVSWLGDHWTYTVNADRVSFVRSGNVVFECSPDALAAVDSEKIYRLVTGRQVPRADMANLLSVLGSDDTIDFIETRRGFLLMSPRGYTWVLWTDLRRPFTPTFQGDNLDLVTRFRLSHLIPWLEDQTNSSWGFHYGDEVLIINNESEALYIDYPELPQLTAESLWAHVKMWATGLVSPGAIGVAYVMLRALGPEWILTLDSASARFSGPDFAEYDYPISKLGGSYVN